MDYICKKINKNLINLLNIGIKLELAQEYLITLDKNYNYKY